MHGVNILSCGSGSSGATNVKRSVGSRAGYAVFLLDFFKGLVPSLLGLKMAFHGNIPGMRMAMLALVGVLLGHNFSLFCKFHGGKGIASTMGGIFIIMPKTLVIGVLVWLVLFHATRIVSVASLCFAASIPLTAYLFAYPRECIIFALVLNLIIFWSHGENIARLASGTEHRFSIKN
jgi:glycerol-3-phosphate acyltransferase PlsY